MRTLVVVLLGLVTLASCQQQKKQYFTASPEIDVVKKGVDAYFSGDWTTFRSAYADTCKVFSNTWDPAKAQGIDDYVKNLQAALVDYSEYKIGDGPIYEMVITDEGDKWVHGWFLWKGVHKNGTAVETPIHISWQFIDNKVVFEANMFNFLPLYLASNPPPSTEVMK